MLRAARRAPPPLKYDLLAARHRLLFCLRFSSTPMATLLKRLSLSMGRDSDAKPLPSTVSFSDFSMHVGQDHCDGERAAGRLAAAASPPDTAVATLHRPTALRRTALPPPLAVNDSPAASAQPGSARAAPRPAHNVSDYQSPFTVGSAPGASLVTAIHRLSSNCPTGAASARDGNHLLARCPCREARFLLWPRPSSHTLGSVPGGGWACRLEVVGR